MTRTIAAAVLIISAVVSIPARQKDTTAPELIDVFVAGDGGYHTYRIPSVVLAPPSSPSPKGGGEVPEMPGTSTSCSDAVMMAGGRGHRCRSSATTGGPRRTNSLLTPLAPRLGAAAGATSTSAKASESSCMRGLRTTSG